MFDWLNVFSIPAVVEEETQDDSPSAGLIGGVVGAAVVVALGIAIGIIVFRKIAGR